MRPVDSLASAHDPLVGQLVGAKWRVVRLIGRGGMGAVYEALNVAIGKRVALKVIDGEHARSPELAGRFQREAEAASRVESAHIVQVFDSGTSEAGVPYIVMELLQGEDLRGRLRRLGKLPAQETVQVALQVLRGLRRAHEAGIVHRDLKPDNVFLEQRDDDAIFAKIVDFGISKMDRRAGQAPAITLTRRGVVLGTPHYMSPEQAQAMPDLDARTDLYAVGAMMYECLTGRPPHGGDSYEQIIIGICTRDAEDPRRLEPSIPDGLAAVVMRALERDRAKRWPSAGAMLDALLATTSSSVETSRPELSLLPPAPVSDVRIDDTSTAHRTTQRAPLLAPARARARRSRLAATMVLATAALLAAIAAGTRLGEHGDARDPAPHDEADRTLPSPPREDSNRAATTAPSPPASSAEAPAPAASPAHAVHKGGTVPPAPTSSAAATTADTPTGIAGALRIKTSYP